MTNNDDILTVAGLNVAYGESKALFDISMNVRPTQATTWLARTLMLTSNSAFDSP